MDGVLEISDCELMIAHVLVNISSGNENWFVVRNFFQNFGKALEAILEIIDSMIHQTEMVTTGYEELF